MKTMEDVGCIICCYVPMKSLEAYFGMLYIEYYCPHQGKGYKTAGHRYKVLSCIIHTLITLWFDYYFLKEIYEFYFQLFALGSNQNVSTNLFRNLMSTYLFSGAYLYHYVRNIIHTQDCFNTWALVQSAHRTGYIYFTKHAQQRITKHCWKQNQKFMALVGALLVTVGLLFQFRITSNEAFLMIVKTAFGIIFVRFTYYEYQMFIVTHLEILQTMQTILKQCLRDQTKFDFVREIKPTFRRIRLDYMALNVNWYHMHQFHDIMIILSLLIVFFWFVNFGVAVVAMVEGSSELVDQIDLLLFISVLWSIESDLVVNYGYLDTCVSDFAYLPYHKYYTREHKI